MSLSKHFLCLLKKAGISFYSGVPCSFLSEFIDEAIRDPDSSYFPSTSEGEAVSIASGAWLGGASVAVFCQNSGLGNMVNPLTSLNSPFKIPLLLLVTHRGKAGLSDEPQHSLMGEITLKQLQLLKIKYKVLPKNSDLWDGVIKSALEHINNKHETYALVIEKDILNSPSYLNIYKEPNSQPKFQRHQVLRALSDSATPNDIIITTTGKTGRELYAINDRTLNLYCVGSMGYASALAQGVALTQPEKNITIIDGDGAALMHLGNMASIGSIGSENLIHIILDNNSYDSTGGQKTLSDSVDFIQLGKSLGYSQSFFCKTIDELLEKYTNAKYYNKGPTLLVQKISKGSLSSLGRPKITPEEVTTRFKNKLKDNIL